MLLWKKKNILLKWSPICLIRDVVFSFLMLLSHGCWPPSAPQVRKCLHLFLCVSTNKLNVTKHFSLYSVIDYPGKVFFSNIDSAAGVWHNLEVSIALVPLTKNPLDFSIWFWITVVSRWASMFGVMTFNVLDNICAVHSFSHLLATALFKTRDSFLNSPDGYFLIYFVL